MKVYLAIFYQAFLPCFALTAAGICLVLMFGCETPEVVQAEAVETRMMTLEQVNQELQLDICDMQKIERVPYTQPEQYLITYERH